MCMVVFTEYADVAVYICPSLFVCNEHADAVLFNCLHHAIIITIYMYKHEHAVDAH